MMLHFLNSFVVGMNYLIVCQLFSSVHILLINSMEFHICLTKCVSKYKSPIHILIIRRQTINIQRPQGEIV